MKTYTVFEVEEMLREEKEYAIMLEKEIKGLKADKETLANSLSIESNRANELNRENEELKLRVEQLEKAVEGYMLLSNIEKDNKKESN